MRTATVVSQDSVQLLAIGRDDFFDIFMSRSGPDGLPDHIRFVSQLDFMKDWPIQNLLEHPECCLFHFFKSVFSFGINVYLLIYVIFFHSIYFIYMFIN